METKNVADGIQCIYNQGYVVQWQRQREVMRPVSPILCVSPFVSSLELGNMCL